MTCGIYSITNNNTESMYVGRASNILRRFKEHCSIQPIDLALYNEGVDNFTLKVVEELPNDMNILKKKERYWINHYNVENDPKHYNVSQSGRSNNNAKYFLWDSSKCTYLKRDMYRYNRELNPCKCFSYRYNNKQIPMGSFEDFLTCEIIDQLVNDALK